MRIGYLKLKSWLLISAMSLLGLSACKKDPSEPVAEYGCPIVPMYGVTSCELRSVPKADDALSQGIAPMKDVEMAIKDENKISEIY